MSSSDRPFRRQLFGYRRADVDEHLTAVDASIADLRTAVDRAAEPAHHDLVQRATRPSAVSSAMATNMASAAAMKLPFMPETRA